MPIYKVLKDFPSRNGVCEYKAGAKVQLDENSRTKALIEMGFLDAEPVEACKKENGSNDQFGVVATSKLANIEIADRDYMEGEKELFTYNEAKEVERKLQGTGWRLPTRREWVLICEEFGTFAGEIATNVLARRLNLKTEGYSPDDESIRKGTPARYWTLTSYNNSDMYRYILTLYPHCADPLDWDDLYHSYRVRLVRDVKETE